MNTQHNPSQQRFEVLIDGHLAYLSYQIIDANTLDYDHTIVPAELGGRGVGSALVRFALDYAKHEHKKITASCSFVHAYIQKHPEYSTLQA